MRKQGFSSLSMSCQRGCATIHMSFWTRRWRLRISAVKTRQKREVALIENGSWAPCAARVMKQMLEEMKDSDIPALEALADAILS